MRKCKKNFTKCENFVKIMSFIAATIICLGELVEFSALIAQYLKICHKNNFSSITWINVWWREFDSTSYLFKFLSVRTRNFRIIFSRNVRIIYIAKYSYNFFAKILHFFEKQIKAKFSRNDFSFSLETLVLILIVCEIQIIKFIL